MPTALGLNPASAVGSPLQACSICEALIDITDCEPLAEVPCPGCRTQIRVRTSIDHFEIINVAGRGGMGVVYKALDTSLERHVALKLLRKGSSDSAALVAQLEAEAAITAAVNHPHVVKVFSTGSDGGRFYIAMELVDQGSLDDLIRLQGRVAEAQMLNVGIQIAQGLRAAHQHGLIHRDVKPGNILFADAHTAKIVDFGLAVFMADEESVRGEIWGTPYYVAPEKLDEKPEDFRSDIYSLGATLFHALAGRPPFEAESASMVALKHLKAQPVSLQTFAPHVSGPTNYVINRTLLKDPGARYQSYDELIEHLEFARHELSTAGEKPRAKARVVIETNDQQKAWVWITAVMIALMVSMVGGIALTMRGAASSPTAKSNLAKAAKSPAASAITEPSAFRDARKKLTDGDAVGAARAFAELALDPKLTVPNQNWAMLQESLAELVNGRLPEAQIALHKIEQRRNHEPTDAQEQKLDAFFSEITARISSAISITPAAAKDINRTNHECIALLLFALKDWETGEVDDAAALLRQFRSATPTGNDAWILEFKPIVSKYVDEHAGFEILAQRLKAGSIEEKALVAVELKKSQGVFAKRSGELLKPFAAQLAEFERSRSQPPHDGIYKIVNRKSGRCLDVEARKTDDGARVWQWAYVGGTNQQWKFKTLGNDAYSILAHHSQKALGVESSSKADGTRVRQYRPEDSGRQQWRVESVGGGFFKLTAESSGKALGIAGAVTDAPSEATQSTYRDGEEQQWMLVPLSFTVGAWTGIDVGKPDRAGTSSFDEANGTYQLKAGGSDIYGTEDACHFIEQSVTGDFELVAHIAKVEHTDDATKVGLMIRDSLEPNSRNVMVLVTPKRGTWQQHRTQAGAQSASSTKQPATAPLWLKLVRTSTVIDGYFSTDGKQWIQLGSDTLPKLPDAIHVGPAATAHRNGALTTATLDNVVLTDRRLAHSPTAR